jgi:hypothetical protein
MSVRAIFKARNTMAFAIVNYVHEFAEKISLKLARAVLKEKMSFLYYDV